MLYNLAYNVRVVYLVIVSWALKRLAGSETFLKASALASIGCKFYTKDGRNYYYNVNTNVSEAHAVCQLVFIIGKVYST